MNISDFSQDFQLSERDMRLYDLATYYHTTCEAYDKTVCTGPNKGDGVLPSNTREFVLINRNARSVLKTVIEMARRDGYSTKEILRAIGKWDERL